MSDLITYNGREIPKHGFRVFVYAKDFSQKLVESWDEFISHIESGEWFSSIEELLIHEELQEESEAETKKRSRKKLSE